MDNETILPIESEPGLEELPAVAVPEPVPPAVAVPEPVPPAVAVPEPVPPAAPPSPPAWPPRPWLTIWTGPRGTMRAILDVDPKRYVLWLAAIVGVGETLSRASSNSTGDDWPVWAIFGLALTLGALGGVISLYISGAVLGWSGGLLGGMGDSEHVRAAVAWATIPQLVAMVFWLPELVLYGEEMFTSYAPRVASNPAPLLFFAVIELILGLWALFLLVKTLAEAHRFSAWRSIGALAIPAIILFGLVFGCLLLVGL
jgi:hypothetical protein